MFYKEKCDFVFVTKNNKDHHVSKYVTKNLVINYFVRITVYS